MLFSMILAGGRGTRLWPVSRAETPKFFHALTGSSESLLQKTSARLGTIVDNEHLLVVTGVSHALEVARQLPAIPSGNILIEPSPRDSCAAIALGATIIERRAPESVVGVFPADHLVADAERFAAVIGLAADFAQQGFITTVGIRPTHAEVGFGYLQLGDQLGGSAYIVEEFREKPSYEQAAAYIASGRYLWNGGMFVFAVSAFLSELQRQKPELHAGVSRIADAWGGPEQETVMREVWPTLEKISVDFGVMEGAAAAGKVATVQADFQWNDIGDFNSLGEALESDEAGNVLVANETPCVIRDTKDTVIVSNSGRLVATVGLQDLVIVDTADALLVLPRSRAQEVKQLVDELKDCGNSHYL